jgi:uncharacterized protein (DUF305 family)
MLGLSACSSDHGGDHPATPAASAVSAPAGDVAFAQGMIPHHEQAVEMADVALAHPDVSDDVRRLATSVKAAQDPEIQTMSRWLSAWGAPTMGDEHAGHDMEGMMSEEDMAALGEAKGEAFNTMWLTMMIEHHEGAVTMAEGVLTTTSNAEVTSLAKAIIEAQQAEIATMRQLVA